MSRLFYDPPLDFGAAFDHGLLSRGGIFGFGNHLVVRAFFAQADLLRVRPADFAERHDVTQQTIRHWLRELAADGWIEIVEKHKGKGWLIRLTGLDRQRAAPSRIEDETPVRSSIRIEDACRRRTAQPRLASGIAPESESKTSRAQKREVNPHRLQR